MNDRLDSSSPGTVVARLTTCVRATIVTDIMVGAVIRALADSVGLAYVMVGSIIRPMTDAMGLTYIVVGTVIRAVTDAVRSTGLVICGIVMTTPAVCAPRSAIAAAASAVSVATVTAAITASITAVAASVATSATTTAAASVPASAASAASATTAATAVTATTTAATTTAAATAFFGVDTGEATDVIRYQDRRCRQDSANCQSQQTFLEEHDEPPLGVAWLLPNSKYLVAH
ncbi:hypothetical protein [Pseudomonas sp. TCU-HL1]|uniref:hypothetical protein n=1 Tax=Pseudomonas sp. TCU-HL1 TaxID=1856685 RepID=UPI0008590101|nr:hypothetical protein THL1_2617 [Pseudomonas sp. TCU-HL1]